MVCLKGRTYQDLAESTGGQERVVCITLPPGSASVLRSLPGKITGGSGLRPTSYDEEFETSSDPLTAKHVDDINMAGAEDTID
eukprot:861446-Pyramimonas_sp.AAC.1